MIGGLDDWRVGGLEGWRVGGLEGWIVGYSETKIYSNEEKHKQRISKATGLARCGGVICADLQDFQKISL